MKDKIKIEFDRYEIGIIINSLNSMRTILINEKNDTTPIDEILLKLIDETSKKKLYKELEAR